MSPCHSSVKDSSNGRLQVLEKMLGAGQLSSLSEMRFILGQAVRMTLSQDQSGLGIAAHSGLRVTHEDDNRAIQDKGS
jgi:hypothetical protein